MSPTATAVFTFHIVQIKLDEITSLDVQLVLFTFHIVQIKLSSNSALAGLLASFTFHIVQIKPRCCGKLLAL